MTAAPSASFLPADARWPPDGRRPRLLLDAARRVAARLTTKANLGATEAPFPLSLAVLEETEATFEHTRRTRPHAWRPAAHVAALGRLLALRASLRSQAKASGSDALRSAT